MLKLVLNVKYRELSPYANFIAAIFWAKIAKKLHKANRSNKTNNVTRKFLVCNCENKIAKTCIRQVFG